ncbi:Short chain dehydrogenase [Pseudomonas savastanoi pv. phaseolicola]|nr:Short chain dehydrogenase [Pseudomonas savastanoi pv. phaseolicola]
MAEDKRAAMFDAAANRLPVGRVGLPDDAAKAICFLTEPYRPSG